MAKFTWKPFFHELAEKLLAYKDKQGELRDKVLKAMGGYATFITSGGKNDDDFIDPFTLIGIINRFTLMSKRTEVCQIYKSLFNMASDVPQDYLGVPSQMPNLSMFYWSDLPYEDKKEDVNYRDYPEMRPLQMLSLMKKEQDDIKVAQPEVTNTFPKEISHMSKCMNLCKSMHFRQLYGINLLNRYHPTKEEMNIGKDLYDEYLEYAKGFGPGEEYDLIQYFVDTFGLSDYVTISDEHLYTAAYEKKKQENDAKYRDDYADEQNARYALEHQDGADPQETLMMAMYMEVAMDHCDKIGVKGTQQLAMECARLGLGGINPGKEYTVHYVSDKQKLNGYQVIAFYYVSMARAFPKLLFEIGLPYTKAYEMALKKYNQKHK